MAKNGANVENNECWVYEPHIKRNKKKQKCKYTAECDKRKHNDHETQQSGKQCDNKMTSGGSKINLGSPEAESEIKQTGINMEA